MKHLEKSTLQDARNRCLVTDFISYRDYLGAVYKCLKEVSDSYSYLKFADDLGFNLTNVMRLIIIGDRPLTAKAAGRVADGLDLHGVERRYFMTMVKYNNARDAAERDQLFKQLMALKSKQLPTTLDQKYLEYFSEWFHPVVREMTGMEHFEGDPVWIQSQLEFPLRLEQIKKSLEVLETLGFIHKCKETGNFVRSEEKIATAFEVDSLGIVKYHQNVIQTAADAITRIDEKDRDISAATVCLPEAAIKKLKVKIHQFMNDILAMEQPDVKGERVYQINVQCYPFTKSTKR